ncbi:MAG: alginate export family protein [Pseudomonadota bacterium]
MKYLLAGLTALTIFIVLGHAPAKARDTSLLDEQLNSPDWLTFTGSQRTRFEVLNGRNVFNVNPLNRASLTNLNGDVFVSNEILSSGTIVGLVSLQTSIFAEADFGRMAFAAELMDSRSYTPVSYNSRNIVVGGNILAAPDSAFGVLPISNAVEPIQAYFAFRFPNNNLELQIGRFTMHLGSGRLVGRSGFRTTINSFHGVKLNKQFGDDGSFTLFYALPHSKRSAEFQNQISYDVPDRRRHFWGLHYAHRQVFDAANLEAFVYGKLGDRRCFSTQLSRIFCAGPSLRGHQITPGIRLYREKSIDAIDFEFEGAAQYSTESFLDPQQENRTAFFAHGEVGKFFHAPSQLHMSFLFDIATGREEAFNTVVASGSPFSITRRTGFPAFDPLFGVFDNDFGPEGLYGVFSRTDLISPAMRLSAAPNRWLDFQITYRAVRQFYPQPEFLPEFVILAPDGSLRAATENNARWGHQIDLKADINLISDHVVLSLGGAFLTRKDREEFDFVRLLNRFLATGLIESADNFRSNTFYGYSSITLNF